MKTTRKHFEIFKKECEYWIDKFGLKDWDIAFEHKSGDNLASARWDIHARWCIIKLATDWEHIKPTDYELKSTAYHEVVELLLADMYTMAGWRYLRERIVRAVKKGISAIIIHMWSVKKV